MSTTIAAAPLRVAVYCVASPLHYLAAARVAADHEGGARQVLVCYRPSLAAMIREADWDAVVITPWPRFDPLPGPFGRLRRTLANLRAVGRAVGPCDEIHLHSPVFDTEAINYYLRALPRLTGASDLRARLLPDGLLNLQRRPLNTIKRLAQRLRRLRRLIHPLLDYTVFSGDRTGSDAPFVDRIYGLAGFPSPYVADRVVTLAALVRPDCGAASPGAPRALVLGQPLVSSGLLAEADRAAIASAMGRWLQTQGAVQIHYKPHPRERERLEFAQPGYDTLHLSEPLEAYLAREPYELIVGCYSTALFTARQVVGPQRRIAAFGLDRVRFKDAETRENIQQLMAALAIEMHGTTVA